MWRHACPWDFWWSMMSRQRFHLCWLVLGVEGIDPFGIVHVKRNLVNQKTKDVLSFFELGFIWALGFFPVVNGAPSSCSSFAWSPGEGLSGCCLFSICEGEGCFLPWPRPQSLKRWSQRHHKKWFFISLLAHLILFLLWGFHFGRLLRFTWWDDGLDQHHTQFQNMWKQKAKWCDSFATAPVSHANYSLQSAVQSRLSTFALVCLCCSAALPLSFWSLCIALSSLASCNWQQWCVSTFGSSLICF